MRRLHSSLKEVKQSLDLDGKPENVAIVQQHSEDLLLYKEDLRSVDDELLRPCFEDEHELVLLCRQLKKIHFDCYGCENTVQFTQGSQDCS